MLDVELGIFDKNGAEKFVFGKVNATYDPKFGACSFIICSKEWIFNRKKGVARHKDRKLYSGLSLCGQE